MEETGHRTPPEAMRRAARAIRGLTARLEALERARREPIAIVGMACRCPGGANDPDAFWKLLSEGREGVTEVPADRWDVDALYDPDPEAPGKMYTKRGGFLDVPVDRFDARFFSIAPREAMSMDPQQRLLLELVWEGLEDAGIAPSALSGSRTGVYLGISTADYAEQRAGTGATQRIDAHSATGNAFSVAAGRISHRLGLNGPNLPVDTACSSSLVAVSLAVQGLRTGQCDGAIVGGVNLILSPAATVAMCKLRALSPRGRCSAFDAAADGYVRGEGGGVVILKRLSDALAAGDRIHAVIRGAAVNHGGRSSGLTVPNPAAQRAVIQDALEDAGVDPAAVDFIEAQGTGTALGDSIELRALDAVFRHSREGRERLPVGAVKTNLGHLEAAAGVAGLIKLVLALSREEIPQNLHLERPTPHVDWDRSSIRVPTEPLPWPRGSRPRMGGVSSFGFSGTNVHLLVEEAPEPERPSADGPERPLHLLPLSARNEEALEQLGAAYRRHLAETSDDLADVCFTAGIGRDHFEHRRLVWGRSKEEIRSKLARVRSGDPGLEAEQVPGTSGGPSVAFHFPGAGSGPPRKGRELYETHPTFRRVLDECDELCRSLLGKPLLPVFFTDGSGPGAGGDEDGLVGAAVFALECGLARLWRSWGIKPSIVGGQGVGRYAAACAAGALSLADGLRLAAAHERVRAAVVRPERSDSASDGSTLATAAAEAEWRRPDIPLFSAFCGQSLSMDDLPGPLARPDEGGDPAEVSPMREALRARGVALVLDVGPGPTEGGRHHPRPEAQGVLRLPSLQGSASEWESLAGALGRLYEAGLRVDWRGFDEPFGRRRVRVPTYPFQRKRYWIPLDAEPAAGEPMEAAPATGGPTASDPRWPPGGRSGHAPRNGRTGTGSIRPELQVAPPEARLPLLTAHIRDRAARVLRTPVEDVEDHRDAIELGFDSLMAMELASALQSEMGTEVAPSDVLEQPSLSALAAHLLEKAEEPAPMSNGGGTAPEADALPLSRGQERIFFLDRSDPGATVYTLPVALRLSGPLDVDALEKALATVLERHEVLRTMLDVEGGKPMQRVHEAGGLALPIDDLSDVPRTRREEVALERVRELRRTPFDLARDVKIRARLLRLADDEHILALAVHHVAADATSLGILLDELGRSYTALTTGRPVAPDPPPLQYRDHAVAERKRIEEGALDAQIAYWRRQLAGASPLELPPDRPRPSTRTYRAGTRAKRFSGRMLGELERLGQEEGATLFMTLLAAFKVLLARRAGTDDVVVGTPIAGRHRPGTERLIGFFINNLVVRTDLAGDPSFRHLVGRVRQVAFDAYRNQDVPFEKLLEELRPRRDPSRTPLFQILFNFLPSFEDSRLSFGDLSARVESLGDEEANFDLTLYVERRDDLRLHLVYNSDLYHEETASELLEQYGTLLAAVAEDPDRRLSTLPLAGSNRDRGPAERRTSEERGGSIPERFAEQVRLGPDSVAVETERHRSTYRELDRYARRIAHDLVERVGHGDGRVGLRVSPGVPMLASILGALGAGKTYVPLDPELPRERALQVLVDADVDAVLWDGTGASLGAGGVDAPPILPLPEMGSSPPADAVGVGVDPESPAYILYTSGSTGEPKGVVQSHANVLRHIEAYIDRLGIEPGDRLTLLSSYGFDAAVVDIFAALLSGATLCPIDLRAHPARELAGELRRRGITVYHSTPTVFRHLVGGLDPGDRLADIRTVVLGGEPVVRNDLESFRRHFDRRAIFVNGYGSTECTFSLLNVQASEGETGGGRADVSLGHPVPGLDVRVLNEEGEPVGTYATGEIVVSGPHIALGYWQRPELTAKAFQPDPNRPGWRNYRTGDLGRPLPDGRIEFAGRKDRQLKIRGFRIEPAEVEAALVHHGMVRAAAILPTPRRGGEPSGFGSEQLVAFVVPASPGDGIDAAALRAHLAERLPGYMIPERFVPVDEIPRTPNGKVDGGKLLDGHAGNPGPESQTEPPRTPAEVLIARIWEELLEVESVGRDDNFYDLGGHSLLAIQVVSRIEEETGARLGPRDLGFQTLRQLAATCDARRAKPQAGSPSLLRRIVRRLNPVAT